MDWFFHVLLIFLGLLLGAWGLNSIQGSIARKTADELEKRQHNKE